MVGMYHYPKARESGGRSVLLCNPFGQEAIRAHRVFKVLADQLALRGVPTLRFDYHGTGDSPGDELDGDLIHWAEDVLSAHRQLESLAKTSESIWIGLRLGALLAALAWPKAQPKVGSLILWEPVADGRAYLEELVAADRSARLQAFSLDGRRLDAIRRESIADLPTEALGSALAPSLVRQLVSLDRSAIPKPTGGRVMIIGSSISLADIDARTFGDATTTRQLDLGISWAANDAGGGTISPTEAIRVLVSSVVGSKE